MAGMRTVLVPGVEGFRASPASYYGTAAPAGAAGGPAGSSSMTFFALMYQAQIITASATLFGRTNRANGGWEILCTSAGLISVRAFNSTPANVAVTTPGSMLTFDGVPAPYLIVVSYQNGTISGWINGTSMGAPITLGAGYTPYAGPTTVGVRSSVASEYWTSGPVSDCGMLDAYDAGAYVDPVFGNGGPGLSARWLADLREGRYLTWPRAGAVNSDWYWAGRDVVAGLGTLPTWTDRYTGAILLKGNQPQGASFPSRP